MLSGICCIYDSQLHAGVSDRNHEIKTVPLLSKLQIAYAEDDNFVSHSSCELWHYNDNLPYALGVYPSLNKQLLEPR